MKQNNPRTNMHEGAKETHSELKRGKTTNWKNKIINWTHSRGDEAVGILKTQIFMYMFATLNAARCNFEIGQLSV